MSLDLGPDSSDTDCYYCEVTTPEWFNDSLNGTVASPLDVGDWEWPSLLVMSVTSTVLGLMILATIIGELEGRSFLFFFLLFFTRLSAICYR